MKSLRQLAREYGLRPDHVSLIVALRGITPTQFGTSMVLDADQERQIADDLRHVASAPRRRWPGREAAAGA